MEHGGTCGVRGLSKWYMGWRVMKVEVLSVLVAETEQEAEILAAELNKSRRDNWVKKVWRLTLPRPKEK